MQPSKWDLILDQKPVPIVDHLLDEISKLFASDLAKWPPVIEDFDLVTGQKLAALLEESPLAPDPRLYAEAFALTRIDLSRDLEMWDEHMRNTRWMGSGLTGKDKGMLLFLSRFMTEQLLGLAELTSGRLKRAQLTDVLERTQRHFFSRGITQ